MTMTVDSNQQRFGPLNFDHMSSYSSQPHFSNPWGPSTSAPQTSSHMAYVSSHDALPNLGLSGLAKHPQQTARPNTSSSASMASYGSIPVTAASAGSPLAATDVYGQQDLLSIPQDLLSLGRMPHPTSSAGYADASYATAASPVHSTYAAASPTPYDGLGYAPAPVRSTFALAPEPDHSRRYSHSSVSSSSSFDPATTSATDLVFRQQQIPMIDVNHRSLHDDRRGFADALEASHGMLSMSQETPRNIYGPTRSRGSGDSYGFPATHSSSSSVSSSTGFSGYYGGSVDSSVSDYSTAGSDVESVTGRTLPRPRGLMSNQGPPPAPQSMMSQFSSKVTSSTQKKHKCKVCDKRFTRPSSLQTHMYSHTGEKPFCCEVEGCGRHFSVVSNLRRHRKVHKGQTPSEADSEDHQSD